MYYFETIVYYKEKKKEKRPLACFRRFLITLPYLTLFKS